MFNSFGEFKPDLHQNTSFKFEKSVAHILRTESSETGNRFVVIIHSLNDNNQNLDLLIRELGRNDVTVLNYFQLPTDRM